MSHESRRINFNIVRFLAVGRPLAPGRYTVQLLLLTVHDKLPRSILKQCTILILVHGPSFYLQPSTVSFGGAQVFTVSAAGPRLYFEQ